MTNQTTTPRISANTNQRTRVLTYTALMAAHFHCGDVL